MDKNKNAELAMNIALCFFAICLLAVIYAFSIGSTADNHLAAELAPRSTSADVQLLQQEEPQDTQSTPWSNTIAEPRAATFETNIAEHLSELKERMPRGDFHVVLEPPFVVIGDENKTVVQQRATETVKWAIDLLKADYFEKDPNQIIDIWLFKDEDSYYSNAEKLFGNKPTTIYGYYSPSDAALVMNISTGGGTLVHEIVHPFIESNFPDCPSWFNEGLASLYEQSSERNGKIVGLVNWRLRGLQLAIKDDRVPEFEELCSTTRREFYDGKSTNYAQARYLCQYLQNQNKLRTFYHTFVANAKDDPTGIQSLKRVLERDDLVAFKKDWEAFVMSLRF